jgi:glycosyltransferase involved in cell wall biosynthesis
MGPTQHFGAEPLVTILINNYNYERYLRLAIESALAQTYPRIEVVVVDDGSTDSSRQIISSFGASLLPIFRQNGGQGAAFNAGFHASSGDIVCFLDADDEFVPEKTASIVQAFYSAPQPVLVYHRLQIIDADSRVVGQPWPRAVLSGNLRSRVEQAGGWWPRATTSGLCCSRTYLERILPMPEAPYRLCADAYVAGLAPFSGRIVGLNAALARYRVHHQNYFNFRGLSREQESIRRKERLLIEFQELKATLRDRLHVEAAMSLQRNLRYQQFRYACGDSVSKLQVLATALRTPTLPLSMRLYEFAKIMVGRS